jgi:hypothetical protein
VACLALGCFKLDLNDPDDSGADSATAASTSSGPPDMIVFGQPNFRHTATNSASRFAGAEPSAFRA